MKRSILFFTFILLLIPAAVFCIDKPFSLGMKRLNMQAYFGYWTPPAEEIKSVVPEDLREVFVCVDILGNSLGVFVLIFILAAVSRKCFQNLPLLVGGVLGAGIISYILKKCIVRCRPYGFPFENDVFQSFQGGALLKNAEEVTRSFPSGHATMGIALLVILAWLFPRGKWCFYFLGFWLMTYRIAVGAHFFSDTLAGVFIGGVFASVCIHFWQKRQKLIIEN